jgi:hypothetical protein
VLWLVLAVAGIAGASTAILAVNRLLAGSRGPRLAWLASAAVLPTAWLLLRTLSYVVILSWGRLAA